MYRVEIRHLPESNNRTERHWTIRHRSAVLWRDLVKIHCLTWSLIDPARVTLTFYGNKKDANNMVKHVMDGLVRAGVLTDDKYPHLMETVTRQRPAKVADRRVLIEVETAPDAAQEVPRVLERRIPG